MEERFTICGYTRISVDLEEDRDNTSIENQKAIIEDFVKARFPGSTLDLYADRDRSGYTFDQREEYMKMRHLMLTHQYDILIVKDFSRFSRRNSRGLVELEDLRDAGMRIISIGDGVDFPKDDDWFKIQIQFLVNEIPVTDTSKKVKSVVKRRQADGKWICAVPYGYVMTDSKKMTFQVDEAQAEIVRKIFELYNDGWGYKRIANYLTERHIPTPRMVERERKELNGQDCKVKAKPEWSIITVQGVLDNDFYIGTLRQGKYSRKKINGANIKKDETEHIVIENHHEAIVDYRVFAMTRELRKKRSVTNYRGVRINENTYSGFLVCGDCGSPMFAMSRKDLAPAYTCGSYHRRGLNGCTSHHVRVDQLDRLVKLYLRRVREEASDMMQRLQESIEAEPTIVQEKTNIVEQMEQRLGVLQEELKATKRQKIRDIMKHPQNEEELEKLYDEMELELEQHIKGLKNQMTMMSDNRNTIIRVNRIAKTALEIFDDILAKDRLAKTDLEIIVDKIIVFQDKIEVHLKADIDALLQSGQLPEDVSNFREGSMDISNISIVQTSARRQDKVYTVNVISEGDPLEIYTDRDGEVIFKKYSPMGELGSFVSELAEALSRTAGMSCAICDRDAVIAAAGGAKKDVLEKTISSDLEMLMEQRHIYEHDKADTAFSVSGNDPYHVIVAAPIITEGDVTGCVAFLSEDENAISTEVESKLSQTAANFLSKHVTM